MGLIMKFKNYLFLLIVIIIFSGCNKNNTSNSVNSNIQTSELQKTDLSSYNFVGETKGCGNFLVYKATKDKTKVLRIEVNERKLNLTKEPQTFDIAETKLINIRIDNFGQETYENRFDYCYDAITAKPKPKIYQAVSGKIIISKSKDTDPFYEVTLMLKEIKFDTSDAKPFTIQQFEIKDVQVGFSMG